VIKLWSRKIPNRATKTAPSVNSTPRDRVTCCGSAPILEGAPVWETDATPASENMGANKARPRPSNRLETTPAERMRDVLRGNLRRR